MASDRDAEGTEQPPESEKARSGVRAFSSKRSIYRNGAALIPILYA